MRRSWPAVLPVVLALCAALGVRAARSAADAPEPDGPCALRTTDAWLSEGATPWDGRRVRPYGTVAAKMIFVRFPDHVPTRTPAQLAAAYLPSVPQFYANASYGRAQLDIRPASEYAAMPRSAAAYAVHRGDAYGSAVGYVHDAVAAARHRVDLAGAQLLYIVADPDAPGVDHDATSAIALADRDAVRAGGTRIRNVALIWEGDTPDHDVVAHESGHLFGLPDLYLEPPDPAGDWDTMVGDWDLMGDQFGLAPEPLAWNKWKFGWLDAHQVDCVFQPGTTRHTVVPTELTGGTKLVVIKRGDTEAYAVEARSPYGNDRGMCGPGVLLYHIRTDVDSGRGPIDVRNAHPEAPGCPGAREPSLSHAAFQPGEAYLGDGFRLAVLGQDGDGNYTVQVTVDRVDTPFPAG